ncbi:hypothetical protein [Amycolatopsis anabasis]|uniref:hypothetical protein n=1 Tax=Amycolatopsis anabasis TaxID=1840409 RepID=UPI00131C94AE|nr:hypothetical protein [Amycolatopsis anabasis]
MTVAPVTTRKHNATLGRPSAAPTMIKEITEMLIYEELARARIRELEEAIHTQRARVGARAGHRIARWITRRARR